MLKTDDTSKWTNLEDHVMKALLSVDVVKKRSQKEQCIPGPKEGIR